MRLVEQILSKPDLISQSTKRLAEEARARVETYASTLIEPPVGINKSEIVHTHVLKYLFLFSIHIPFSLFTHSLIHSFTLYA